MITSEDVAADPERVARVGLNLVTLDYPEPEPEYEYIPETRMAGHLSVGDRVKSGNIVYPVASHKTGHKWTYLTFEDPNDRKPLKREVLNNEQFEVEVRRQTQASREAMRRHYKNISLQKTLKRDPKEQALASLESIRSRYEAGQYFDSSLASFLEEQADAGVTARLKHIAENNYVGAVDLVEVRDLLVEDLKERLYGTMSDRVLSRSTSVVDNLLEDLDRAATVRFIQHAERGW